MEIMSLGLQGMDNHEEFTVIDIIVTCSGNKRLEEVEAWVLVIVGVSLKEDGTQSILRSISDNSEGFGEVREMEDRV